MFFAHSVRRWYQFISSWIWFICYRKCFQQETCWYLQMVKSEQIIFEYKKDPLYDIFEEEI